MADINNNVNEVVQDLKRKIDELTKIDLDVDGESKAKINAVKQKAITVLNTAASKVVDIAKDITDENELQKGIDIIKVRSKELYDNAISKINELSNTKVIDEVKDIKDEINEFFEKEEIKNSTNNVKEVTVAIADKAVATLKQWLKPEE